MTRHLEGQDIMMEGCCGMGMMVAGWVAILLGLGLLASLLVLVWVIINRLRRDSSGSGLGQR